MFQNGLDFDASKLYPPVEYPVSRGTAMIAPVIEWDHSEDYFVPLCELEDWFDKRNVLINISDKEFEFIKGHVIDGQLNAKTLSPVDSLILKLFLFQARFCSPELACCC